jgi:hypothetical protein
VCISDIILDTLSGDALRSQ